MANITLSGNNPTVDFNDTGDSTNFHIDVNNSTMYFGYGGHSAGRIQGSANAALPTPLIVTEANSSEFLFVHSSFDNFRFESSSSGKLMVAAFVSSTWTDVLVLAGGASPNLEFKGKITNMGAGGAAITFEKDTGTGNIADFYCNLVRKAYIHNDGLVDLSTGGLRLKSTTTYPTASAATLRNIYFEDDTTTPKIVICTVDGTPSYSNLTADLVAI
jgi:hypothetical protein